MSTVLFTAVLPPPNAIDALAAAQDALRPHLPGRVTWVDPEHFHVTVWFLGEEKPDDPQPAWGTENLPGPFDIELRGYGSKRVRWGDGHRSFFLSGGGCEPLVQLQSRVNSREGYPPHVTLARGRHAIELPEIETPTIVFPAERLVLLRSERGDGKAGYSVVRKWELGT